MVRGGGRRGWSEGRRGCPCAAYLEEDSPLLQLAAQIARDAVEDGSAPREIDLALAEEVVAGGDVPVVDVDVERLCDEISQDALVAVGGRGGVAPQQSESGREREGERESGRERGG